MKAIDYREVVLVEDLAPLVQSVLDKRWRVYNEENTTSPGGQKIGPVAELSLESKVPERRIHGILKGETAAVDLDIADRLLLACGLFVELELPDSIFPASEVHNATIEQSTMLPVFAKSRGIAVPALGSTERKYFGGKMRRLAERERTAAA